jgi:hypothetical protein
MANRKCTCLLLLSAAAAICADQGSISGKILTAAGKGAAVPKAPVEAKNVATQATYKATSAADGTYEFSGLPTGQYEISVENVQFFLPFHEGGVRVVTGKTTRLDIRLEDFQLGTLGDGGEQFAGLLKDGPLPSGPAPRASDGRPDLSGIWGLAWHPEPVGKEPQPLPWAEDVAKQRGKRGRITDLGTAACLPAGIGGFGPPQKIVQTPSLIVILDGNFNPDRQIYLDGRGHPRDFNPSWMGHSVGHWEGDTLVVDTVGFNDLGWVSVGPSSFPQTEKLHITEQFRRLDMGHLQVERTYDDPGAFRQPFTMREVHPLEDEEVSEYVCAENNRDLPHLLNAPEKKQ